MTISKNFRKALLALLFIAAASGQGRASSLDLRNIVHAWANCSAGYLHTSVFFSVIDYNEQAFYLVGNANNHPDYQAMYQPRWRRHDMSYGKVTPVGWSTVRAASRQVQNNRTRGWGSMKFKYSENFSDTASWSTTDTWKVGYSWTITAGLPGVASVSATPSVEYSTATTNGGSKTWGQTVELDQTVPCAPLRTTIAEAIVSGAKARVRYTMIGALDGYAAVWFNDAVDFANPGGGDNHHLWFVPITWIINECYRLNICSTAGYWTWSDCVLFSGGGYVSVNEKTTQSVTAWTTKLP